MKNIALAFSTIRALREWQGKTEWLLLLEDDFEVDPQTLKGNLALKATTTQAEMLWLDYRSAGNTAVGVGLYLTKGAPLCCTEGLLIHRSIRLILADALAPNSAAIQEFKRSGGFKAGYLATTPHTDFILSFLCYTRVCCSWSPISTRKLHSFQGRL